MRLSVSVTNFSWPDAPAAIRANLAAVAEFLDGTDVDTLWVADHLLQADPASRLDEPMLEAYTTLGFLAAKTTELRLGTLVTATTFRDPAVLIKAVTTLDVLSGGRAWLGLGAGYNADEARALGLFLPPAGERFDRMGELLQLARRMWDGDESPYEGRYYRAERPIGRPRPITRPPVLIGGTGERRTLRMVAEYADACNLFDIPNGDSVIRRQLDALGRHCDEIGRARQEIEHTLTTALTPGESADQLVERCRKLAVLGIQHVVVIARGRPWTLTELGVVVSAASQLATVEPSAACGSSRTV
ncbi:LLM class F420-dependent oxidoreductase [Mycolicibacterium mucogenicum]|uniref:LLM class F420-dependent oxidoreductase n=1 Tax=Mycolicibacterium mucogenicum TaxID=56689 RepID=A0A1A3HDP6_MYCMU|nr:TIGR03560 family F420-dependent LLM class oxidoreductase [Mycolicibacterium mucogenicum]OBJ45794.1 LLM class F420-dependent oxidoreductase [Mycolicibacterium mucogenicum]